LEFINEVDRSSMNLYKNQGCNACNQTGYLGRVGVYEIMPITPAVRNLINKGANADEIKEQAIKDGMNTLKKNCSRLVAQGVTTIDELVRVAYAME
jgi:type IV pilus assembly protein PilB